MAIDALLINLTRFGDLLQTQATIDDLHSAGFRVGLVCLANFASAASLLRNLEQTWPLPGARFLNALDRRWPTAIQDVLAFCDEVKAAARPAHVINLTPALPARLLSRLLTPPDGSTLGFGLDEHGFGLNHGVWASYVAVAANQRGNSPFNLSDMLRMLAAPLTGGPCGSSLLKQPAEEDLQWADDFLAQGRQNFTPARFMAFQLGASEERRRWPLENFAELAARLWQQARICPVLVGSPSERQLAENYAAHARAPFLDAIGQTNLPQLAALLSRCELLVTNDTGTMHLAAGLGVPSLAFFMATAQPWDTGPALPGCCCLEPALPCHPCSFLRPCQLDHICRHHIDAKSVADLITAYLPNRTWQASSARQLDHICRVWLTTRDENGLNRIVPLNDSANSGSGLWLAWQRQFWLDLLSQLALNKDSSTPGPAYAALKLPDNARELAQLAHASAQILATIAECASNAAKNRTMAQIFLKNCDRLQTLLDSRPVFNSLAVFWRELRSNPALDIKTFDTQARIIATRLNRLGGALQA